MVTHNAARPGVFPVGLRNVCRRQLNNNKFNANMMSPKIFRKSRGGDFCCMPGCVNTRRTDNDRRSYFRFPPEGTRQFSQWVKSVRVRRPGWYPRKWDRVCSDHFVNGEDSFKMFNFLIKDRKLVSLVGNVIIYDERKRSRKFQVC